MVTESYDYQEVEKTMMYYSTPLVKESDFPFNFYLLDLPQNNTGRWVKHLVDLWMANMPNGQWANWVVWHFFLSFAFVYNSHSVFYVRTGTKTKTDEVWSLCHAVAVTMVAAYCGCTSELFRPCHVNCKLQTMNRKENKILYVFTPENNFKIFVQPSLTCQVLLGMSLVSAR